MNTPSPEDPVHPDTTLIQRLGYAGLIPFVGLALLLWLLQGEPQVFVSVALAAYAGLILSFLGGIHWGIGWLQAGRRDGLGVHFLWGVMPSLLAWPGVLMPPYAGLVWLGLVLIVCYLVDRRLLVRAGLTPWLTMRFRLTTVASLSCFLGAGAL